MVFDALKIIDNATQEIDEREKRANINEDLMIAFLKQCLSNVEVNKENAILLTARVLLTALHTYGVTQQADVKAHKRHNAKKGGRTKHKNSGIKEIKSQIKELWTEWQTLETPKTRYKSLDSFALDMLDKFRDTSKENDTPQSSAVITRWCRVWKKEQNTTQPT
jgi:hypothetical protein